MTLRTLVSVVLAAGSLLAAPVPKEFKKSDADRLQGAWAYDSFDDGGGRCIISRLWTFRDSCMAETTLKGEGGIAYRFALRPEKSPAEIDLRHNEIFGYTCIYKLIGDELHIAWNPGKDLPKDFKSAPGKYVYILKRLAGPAK